MQRSTSRNKLLTRILARSTFPDEPRIPSESSILFRRVSCSRTLSSRRCFSPCNLSRSFCKARHSAAIRSWSAISRSTSALRRFITSFSAIKSGFLNSINAQRYKLFGKFQNFIPFSYAECSLRQLCIEVVILRVGDNNRVEATTQKALA